MPRKKKKSHVFNTQKRGPNKQSLAKPMLSAKSLNAQLDRVSKQSTPSILGEMDK